MTAELIDKLQASAPQDAALLAEKALTQAAAEDEAVSRSVDDVVARFLSDQSLGNGFLPHISLTALEGLTGRSIERLRQTDSGSQVELGAMAWNLLDVVRQSEVLCRITRSGTLDEWAERIQCLIELSQYTFGRLFDARVAKYGPKTLFKLPGRGAESILSWREVGRRVERIARGLLAVTAKAGDRPIALLSENRLEVALTDLACLSTGIVNVMIPANATDNDVGFILRHAGVGAVIASSREQMQKVLMHRGNLPDLKILIALDENAGVQDVLHFRQVLERASEVSSETIIERRNRVRSDDLATVMYTSGTTGVPKGIMFSQRNIVFKRFARALALPEIGEGDRFLCYLPLFHTFGRFLEMAACVFWGSTYCFAENPAIDTLARHMKELNPTVFISIPMKWMQLYERIRQKVDVEVADDATIKKVTHEVTGGHLKWGLSAAGYLDPDVFEFFQRQGIELMSGFGMTEATGGITMTPPGRYKAGSLGRALPGIELQLADDGELKIRGPYVMMGYLDPPDGEPSFDEEGWLASGDIMEMDEEGFIRLVDRKKEIYKNIKGQTIAPQRVENLFRDFDSVGRIFLVGDHRQYNTALIFPNPDFKDLNFESLSREEVKAHFRSLVVSSNAFIEPFERIVDFTVINREFDPERGELTPKGTYRRKVIESNFADVIELMYRRTTLTVGGAEVTVPNWFFQKLGITTQDLAADGDRLILASTGTSLTVKEHDDTQTQVGCVLYRHGPGPLDLGVLLRTPSLWLGNEELVLFAPLELRHRNRRRQLAQDLEWVRRTGVYEATEADRRAAEVALTKKDLDLIDIHRVAAQMEAAEAADAVQGVRVLEHVWSLDDGQLRDETLKILRRAKFSSHPEVCRRAFQILVHAEPLGIFSDTLSSFLDSPAQVLDSDTISILAERDMESQRLDAFIRETERRCHRSEFEDEERGERQTGMALVDFLSEFGAMHPSHYRRLRGFITRMSVEPAVPEIKQQAAQARRRLEDGFRAWLGPASRIAVDPETAREYRWEDVVEFSDDVDEEAKRRLLDAFKATPMLREAVFLFSEGLAIRLDDILPNGVWVRLLGTDHGKSVYRVAVKTRLSGQFDLAVNLNRSLSADQVKDEIDWLIVCGESRQRSPLVERFGGYWPEQDLWTEEFIAGETLDRALKRLARQKHHEERYLNIWPYAAWSALSAHVDLWRRTGEADPTPTNVVVPMHDYHTGAHLVSIAGRRSFSSFFELLQSLKHEFVESIEREHTRLRGTVGWEIVYSAVLEVVGEERGVELLESALQDAHHEKDAEFRGALQRFVASVQERGFLPMRLFFAAKRYRRWMRLNPDATLLARARTLQEIYETYNLDDLYASYPEVRARFFLDTIFRESDPPLVEGLKNVIQKLRKRELEPDDLSFAVADLRSELKLSADEDYFLTRLSYPYLQPEDEAEFVPAEVGGSQQSEMVVTLEDSDGNPYRIRHALNPKEVGRLHGLFLTAKLPVQFRPDHRFLVAVSERGHLVGGLFYEVDFEAKTAYMDKVVVSDRFQRKGVAGVLMEELSNRLKTAGYRSLTTGFFRPQFFYRYGFTVEKNYAGLVRSLVEVADEGE